MPDSPVKRGVQSSLHNADGAGFSMKKKNELLSTAKKRNSRRHVIDEAAPSVPDLLETQ